MAIVRQIELQGEDWAESGRVSQGMMMGRRSDGDLRKLATGRVPGLHVRHRAPGAWRMMAQAELERRARLEA